MSEQVNPACLRSVEASQPGLIGYVDKASAARALEAAIREIVREEIGATNECGDERCGRCYTDDTAEAGHRCDDTPATCPTCGNERDCPYTCDVRGQDSSDPCDDSCRCDDSFHTPSPVPTSGNPPVPGSAGKANGGGEGTQPDTRRACENWPDSLSASPTPPPVPVRDEPLTQECDQCGRKYPSSWSAGCFSDTGDDDCDGKIRPIAERPSPGGPASCRDATDSERQDSRAPSQHATTGPRLQPDQPDHAAVLRRAARELREMGEDDEAAHYDAGAAAIERVRELAETNAQLSYRNSALAHDYGQAAAERGKALDRVRELEAQLSATEQQASEYHREHRLYAEWKQRAEQAEAECDRMRGELSAAVHLSDVRLADLDALRARYDRLREDAVVAAKSVRVTHTRDRHYDTFDVCLASVCIAARRIIDWKE